jgi:hypothetical protein
LALVLGVVAIVLGFFILKKVINVVKSFLVGR